MTSELDDRAMGRAAGSYTLAVGEGGALRLRLVDEVYGPGTRRLLERAGLRAGMQVADIGCGIGTVSAWLGATVGAEGSVVGLDSSAAQLAEAAANAAARGVKNVRFLNGSAYRTDLPRAAFDLVYCRLLLMHLERPGEALGEMRALLKPGGVLVCEEATIESSFCEPPSPHHTRLQELAVALGHRRGCDFNVARHLYHLVRAAGFARVNIDQHQPVFARGEAKRVEELSFREVAPHVVESGVAGAAEVEEVIRGVHSLTQDDNVVYSLSRMTQVWANT